MGLSPAKMLIFIEEQERCGIGRAPDMGIQMVGPLLIKHGTADQRERYLPKILAGEEVWCQGYSEPNAGSDLASLKTEAIANGDEFIINGQKTWTTLAQDATHMFCLARTSKEGKPQEGISFFLIDLDQPGITIRPIKNLAGDEEFCEVFLDNVKVPADCLVGAINEGWTIAKALLSFERIFIGSPKQSQYAVKRLEVLAKASGIFDKNTFREKLTRLKLNVLDLESTYQQFADIVRRGETLGPDVSLLKIWGTETFARLSELMVETAGAEGANIGKIAFGDSEVDVMSQFYNARPATIYGGSNEIQRNIIAKGVLNLPKN
jgi:alkylation response protein AidB-like acyl-CoA dehydrogenase